MDMVKVDPKLFVTCRLCLEEMGMYQITPVVQHQIKYCFDIDVDQYDGLPQLICAQCESILSEYFTKKRIFVGRQNALKAKLQVRKEVEDSLCPSPPHEAVSSSQQNDSEEIITKQKSTSKSKKRKSRLMSSSNSSSASLPASREASGSPTESLTTDHITVHNKSHENLRPKIRRESWEANYTKRYVCKICNKYLKFGGGIGNHVKTHANLISKYQDIMNRTCTVKLIKVDRKANPTGNSDTVALTQEKIIGKRKENVYVLYTKEDASAESTRPENKESVTTCAESEDDEDEVIPKSKQVKRRRLLSRSSTDTVILNDDDKSPTSDAGRLKHAILQNAKQGYAEIECINIDDSSNGSNQSDNVAVKDNDTTSVKPKDVEAIKNLVRVCHNKYVSKRQELLETEKQANKGPQLKRKLLSMGRKVIHKQGLACTGLLRFIARKNLEVKWMPAMPGNKETNYVRIMPRLKGKDELVPDNLGWKKRSEDPENRRVEILPKQNVVTSETNPNMSRISNPISEDSTAESYLPNNGLNPITQNSNGVINPSSDTSIEKAAEGNEDDTETSSMLFVHCDKKLLNANPVANPKQLPKKCNITESKQYIQVFDKVVEKVIPEYPQQSLYIDLDSDQHTYDTEMPMPIITSTTSLAYSSTDTTVKTEHNDNTDDNPTFSSEMANELDKPAPRIKVKPVSELMSERVLKNLGQQQSGNDNIWTANSTPSVPTSNGLGLVITQVTSEGVPVNPNQLIPPSNSDAFATLPNSRSYVILDTVEMPNTKTESPVQYFRNLLHFHNIVLLDSNESLPPNAVCLIKFKLQFLRDMNQPVTLCLSIHCEANRFYLGVKDTNQVNYIDLNMFNAIWQWEILKIYTARQDVINKMIQNAQKASQEVHAYTKTFFSLLRSINFKKDEGC